jgi:hypothetical protein
MHAWLLTHRDWNSILKRLCGRLYARLRARLCARLRARAEHCISKEQKSTTEYNRAQQSSSNMMMCCYISSCNLIQSSMQLTFN